MLDNRFPSFLIGLGAGVGLSMLFAPKSGSETRNLIAQKINDGKTLVESSGERVRNSANDLLDRGKAQVTRVNGAVTAAVEAGKSALSAHS